MKEQYKYYIFAATAQKDGVIYQTPMSLTSDNSDEALGKAWRLAQELFPFEDGYRYIKVTGGIDPIVGYRVKE